MPRAAFTGSLGASGVLETTSQVVAPLTKFSATNLPCALKAGETLRDNMPTGVTVVNASTYSSSTDLYIVLKAVEAAVSSAVYVQLDAKIYRVNNFDAISSAFYGYHNGARIVMGLIGYGADSTFIQVAPTAMSSTQHTVTSNSTAYNAVTGATTGTEISTSLYFTDSNSTTPLFFSGICFQGTLQTPYSPVSNNSGFRINTTAASPLPWCGWSIWNGLPGSRVQYCRFQGFGFAMQASPPYECGFVNTNRNNGLTWYRCDMDGRIASSIDTTQPVASGGLMFNKETLITVQDSWMHHTRRSGFATNTNTMSTAEQYVAINFQTDNVANTSDTWAGSLLGFNASNVEGVVGTFSYTNCNFTSELGQHIHWSLPYSGGAAGDGVYTAPDHTVFFVNGFTTTTTATTKTNSNYGGCLVIGVSQTPNSTGTSPAWQSIKNNGIAGSGFFDIRNSQGVELTGVQASSWVEGTHTPDKYFVVAY